MRELAEEFPRLKQGQALSALSWLRTGGAADWFFMPQDIAELSAFLKKLPSSVPVFPMGLGSNTIFRDGGVEGVVIRPGRGFMSLDIKGNQVLAGAQVLDSKLAIEAAKAGIDLTFLRTIPGAVGGAVIMNAGCYGRYVADVLVDIEIMHRNGEVEVLEAKDLKFHYRQTELPANISQDAIVIAARFQGEEGDPALLEHKMEEALAKRAETQPVNERSCGSTFRNPVGYSSTGADGEDHSLKAWKVIDDAGLRGATLGGAQMSPIHPNFLVNTGDATAYDLEALGEEVRTRVKNHSGIELQWEIKRVGRFLPEQEVLWDVE